MSGIPQSPSLSVASDETIELPYIPLDVASPILNSASHFAQASQASGVPQSGSGPLASSFANGHDYSDKGHSSDGDYDDEEYMEEEEGDDEDYEDEDSNEQDDNHDDDDESEEGDDSHLVDTNAEYHPSLSPNFTETLTFRFQNPANIPRIYPPNGRPSNFAPPHCYAIHYHFLSCGHVSTLEFCMRIRHPAPNFQDYFTCSPIHRDCRIWHDVELKRGECPWCVYKHTVTPETDSEGPWFQHLPLPKIATRLAEVYGDLDLPVEEISRRNAISRQAYDDVRGPELEVRMVKRGGVNVEVEGPGKHWHRKDWEEMRHLFKYRIWICSLGVSRMRLSLSDPLPAHRHVLADLEGPEVHFHGVVTKNDLYSPLQPWEITRIDKEANCSVCWESFGPNPNATSQIFDHWLVNGRNVYPVRLACDPSPRPQQFTPLGSVDDLPVQTTHHIFHSACITSILFRTSLLCPTCRVSFTLPKHYNLLWPGEGDDFFPEMLFMPGYGEWFDWQVSDEDELPDAGPDNFGDVEEGVQPVDGNGGNFMNGNAAVQSEEVELETGDVDYIRWQMRRVRRAETAKEAQRRFTEFMDRHSGVTPQPSVSDEEEL
jgi:hypothetical protein